MKPSLDLQTEFKLLLSKACVVAVLVCVLVGCSRQAHRQLVDQEVYHLLGTRQFDSRWSLPSRTVEADPRSRLADVEDPDEGPLPPDDPAANRYLRHPYHSRRPVTYWDRRGVSPAIDQEQWLQHLLYDANGDVVIDKQMTIDLALLHSRDFQTNVETLYTTALALSSNRFEFDLNWFGGSDGTFFATGDGAAAQRDLTNPNSLGFTRDLAAGGQFATTLANSFTWNLGGSGNTNSAVGNLALSLVQPLLRGAFRHIRTETLTQAERSLLYAVRDFARFRRVFYLSIVTEYLNLLNQVQAVNIEQENIVSLELNLKEHEILLENGRVSPIQVDQVFQSLQSGRLVLINANQGLQTQLDNFKFLLGLPARIPLRLSEDILQPFQLNSPEAEQLQQDIEELKRAMNQYIPPREIAPPAFLDDVASKIKAYAQRIEKLKEEVDQELDQWLENLERNKPAESADESERIDYDQQVSRAKTIQRLLAELDEQIKDAKKAQDKKEQTEDREKSVDGDKDKDIDDTYEQSPEIKRWDRLERIISQPRGLRDRISTLFVQQTQIRLFLIEIKPLRVTEQQAVELALQNRFDLMNSRGAVVDAYRAVEIAADQLQSDLSVSASANLATDPTSDNPFRFDGDENDYTLGVEFDGPLNRLNERNAYRASQIAYQQTRRAYMADEDAIVNAVRLSLRQLQTNLFNFRIARQTLITATRQVEQAQLNLRSASSGDSSLTQDLLLALAQLRDNKNNLISSWINYETSRIAVFVDLELLLLDERGVWINDQEEFDVSNEPFTNESSFSDRTGGARNDQPPSNGRDLDQSEPGDGELPPPPTPITKPPRPPLEGDATERVGSGLPWWVRLLGLR